MSFTDYFFPSASEIPEGATTEEAIDIANKKTEELEDTQKKVDRLLTLLPKDHPAYNKLAAEKSASRGFFDEYVVPAWKAVQDALGLTDASPGLTGLGLIPLIVGAVIAGSVAIVFAARAYVSVANASIEREKRILDDPSIPDEIKRKVLLQGGGILEILEKSKGLVIGGSVAAIGLILVWRFAKPAKRLTS